MALIFQQLMTPYWLLDNARPASNSILTIQKDTLLVDQPQGLNRNLLLVKLYDALRPSVPDYAKVLKQEGLTYSIELAFDHAKVPAEATADRPLMHRLYVMLTEHKAKTNSALGFRIEGDPRLYGNAKIGPCGGVRATIPATPDAFQGSPTLIDPGNDRMTTGTGSFPMIFKILMKPGRNWGACYSPIDSGHLHVVDYQTPLTFASGNMALALFSDDGADADRYRINYIDLSIYKED